MNPRSGRAYWGPRLWYILHSAAELYTPSRHTTRAYEAFLTQTLVQIIPCSECQRHTADYLANRPPHLASRDSLRMWTYNFHNYVNNLLQKPRYVLNGIERRTDKLQQNYIEFALYAQSSKCTTNTLALNNFTQFMQPLLARAQGNASREWSGARYRLSCLRAQ